jgi:hypothetical protein
MAYRGEYFPIENFKGGYCGNLPPTQLELNQAADLDNIIVKPNGLGFRTRPGTSKHSLASVTIQNVTYTAKTIGSNGELITVAYTTGGTAGAEVVTVVGRAISVKIEHNVSTGTNVRTAVNASVAAAALVAASGTSAVAQTAPVTATPLVAIATLNSGVAIQGIGYIQTSGMVESIGAIAGAKFYGDPGITGVFTDFTGTASITAGAGNKWDFLTFNNSLIGFGGSPQTPDAPFKWDGTTTPATPLGGSAPSAYGAFAANNRVFAYRTSANPSTIYWSAIGIANDFASAGSGSAVVGSLSDNQTITAACILSTNYVLIFKENSTYQMVISSAPFPIYTLFDKEGCCGKNAVINVDGKAYWMNLHGEMFSTDGETLQDYPKVARDLWEQVQRTEFKNICAFHIHGKDFMWLVWMVSTTGSTNNMAIIWDLVNECWLKASTGFKMNVQGTTTRNEVYLGGYDGFVYRPLTENCFFDGSETTPGTITGYWRSGWVNPATADRVVQVRKVISQYKTKASGTVGLTYGFDFDVDHASTTLSQIPTGSELYTSRQANLEGRGNFFQFKIGGSSSTIDTEVDGVLLAGKSYGQKKIGSN